jgi:hypothetical protein
MLKTAAEVYMLPTSDRQESGPVAIVSKTSYEHSETNCDCGFAVLNDVVTESEIQKYVTLYGVAECTQGDAVHFVGGISQVVDCFVKHTKFTVIIKERAYMNQLWLSGHSCPCDSGALLIRKADSKAVGLVMATLVDSNDIPIGAVASPITEVQKFLEVTLITR